MATSEFNTYFDRYIKQSNGSSPREALANGKMILQQYLKAVSENKAEYAYAPGKWSLREMLQHLIDAERIFCYRALAIARGEKQVLPGFEEEDYAARSGGNARSWSSLSEEMEATRRSTEMLFASFDEAMNATEGRFSATAGTPHQLGLIIAGHCRHHIAVAERLYGIDLSTTA